MTLPTDRTLLLKIAAGLVAGLFLLDYVVIEPAVSAWSAQSDRIAALQKKVDRGQTLLDREDRIRNVWAAMQRANLPADNSVAEAAAFTAMNHWKADSGIALTNLTPQWQTHEDEGYDAFECRAAGTGDQVSIGRFLFDLNTDALPCNLEECEISTRDAHGQQLTMTARFSFARVSSDIRAGLTPNRSTTNTTRGRSSSEE